MLFSFPLQEKPFQAGALAFALLGLAAEEEGEAGALAGVAGEVDLATAALADGLANEEAEAVTKFRQ